MRFMQNPELQAKLGDATGYAGPVKGLDAHMNPEAYANLATNAANAAKASIVDTVWWSENETRMREIWSRWVATGVYQR
jgi:spermidine/putrescine-binding protein